MKTKKDYAEILALREGRLSEKKRKALLAALNDDEELRAALASQLAFEDLLRLASADLSGEIAEGEHFDDAILITFVQGKLAPEKAEQVRTHLRACRDCFVKMARLQRALKEREHAQFAGVPESLIKKAKQLVALPVGNENEAGEIASVAPENFWQRAVSYTKTIVSSFAAPIVESVASLKERWQANPKIIFIPAGVAVAIVILFMLLLPKPAVENFAENRLVILDDGPLGFTAEREVRKYEGMSVRASEDGEHLIFQWAAVPEAVSYEILLAAGGKANKHPLSVTAEGLSFTLPKQEVELDTKYSWELRGKLKDGRTFMAKAGFVCRK